MSDVARAPVAQDRRPRARKPRVEGRSGRRAADTAPLRDYLSSLDLGVTPTIHVNGHAYHNALVTVDLGQPLKPAKLSPEQGQEFNDHLRKLAREVVGKDVNIRISYDNANGVYWAAVA